MGLLTNGEGSIMSLPQMRCVRLLAAFVGAVLLGPAAPANAQFPTSVGLAGNTIGVGVGPTQPTSVLGQVSVLLSNNLEMTEPPSPLVVFKKPSGCIPAPAPQGGRLPHNLYNQTNVDVQSYADANCTFPLVRIRANQGSHFDYVFNSFKAVVPIETNTAIAGQNIGVGVAPSSAVVAPVSIYVGELQPLVNFDPPPAGCQSITYTIPQFAPHSMLNNGTGTLRIFPAANCQGTAMDVPPGHTAHLGASPSWSYGAAAGTVARVSTRASTRRIAACVRAARRKRGSARAAAVKRCTPAKKRSSKAATHRHRAR